jgi:hypothetical protein
MNVIKLMVVALAGWIKLLGNCFSSPEFMELQEAG